MSCHHPIHGFICKDGRFTFNPARRDLVGPQSVRCGQCVGCRLDYSSKWATRCVHEASLYPSNCFLTLTYDDAHLPKDMSLDYKHIQDFLKRLRDRFNYVGADGVNRIRYFVCGEYGEKRARPHYHMLLFNFDFTDKYEWAHRNGNVAWRSPMLDGMPRFSRDRSLVTDALWHHGNSEIGECNFKSAAYAARYIMKKQTGDKSSVVYEYVDSETGEVFDRVKEFCHMSTSPGLGRKWIEKYYTDVYPHDYVVVNGHRTSPPRYYDDFMRKHNPNHYEIVKSERGAGAYLSLDDNTPDRLDVKERLAFANLSRLVRNLD